MTSLIFDVIGRLYPKDQSNHFFCCQQVLLNKLHIGQKYRDMRGCHQSVIYV